jgi:hypothetical protein
VGKLCSQFDHIHFFGCLSRRALDSDIGPSYIEIESPKRYSILLNMEDRLMAKGEKGGPEAKKKSERIWQKYRFRLRGVWILYQKSMKNL